jgi:cobalamin biosynthesis Mg chelatase CobN
MDENDIAVMRAIGALKPHRITSMEQMARMVVHREYIGRVVIRRYVDPLFVAGLERQGYDPDSYVRKLIEVDARND